MHFEEIKELEPVSRRVIPKTKFIIWNILKPVLDFKLSKTLKTAFFCYHTKKYDLFTTMEPIYFL